MRSELDGIFEHVKREIEESANCKISVISLAKKYRMNRKDLHYRFILTYGFSIHEYHDKLKFELFQILVKRKVAGKYRTSYDIADALGFSNDSGLQYFLKRMCGLSFKQYLSRIDNGYTVIPKSEISI